MSTQHIVHKILEPGLPGDGFTAVEAQQVRDEIANYGDAVERIDPGVPAPAVGATLRQGPSGPAWGAKEVSADWFSNPNDAIDAAGPGGRVVFSKNQTYLIQDTIRLKTGTQLVGVDRATTILRADGIDSLIQSDGLNTRNVNQVFISNMTLHGGWAAETILDARDITRGHFDNLEIMHCGPNGHSVFMGGDSGYGGWSNSLWRSLVRNGNPGYSGSVYLHGRMGVGRTGAYTANNNSFIANIIYSAPTPDPDTSSAIHIEEGEQNHFTHNDLGYNPGTTILLGASANYNSFIDNRVEDSRQCVLLDGGNINRFISNMFHMFGSATEPAVYIGNGSERNVFAWNIYAGGGDPTRVVEAASSKDKNTFIGDNGRGNQKFPTGTTDYVGSGALVRTRTSPDTNPRFALGPSGDMSWGPGNAGYDSYLMRLASAHIGTEAWTKFQIGNGTWNGGHLIMGTYHLWVDATGKLRMKNGVPTSSTDGAVVGSQT